MTKERHHRLMFSGPAGQQNPYTFSRDLMESLGCPQIPIVFEGNILKDDVDEIARDTFTSFLTEGDNNGKIPRDSRVMLNVERPSCVLHEHLREQQLWYQPNQFGIDLWLQILEVAKAARPDCTFGFWGELPNTRYSGVLDTGDRVPQWRRKLAVACWPLAEQCDFLVPALYDSHTWPEYNTLDDRFRWVRKSLEEAKLFCRPVLPMFMVEYIDSWRRHYKPDKGPPIPDTPEAQAARMISGYRLKEYLRLADKLADGFMLWGGQPWGTNPFPFDSEAWHVIRRILAGQ